MWRRITTTMATAGVLVLTVSAGQLAADEPGVSVVYALDNGDTNGDLQRDLSDGIHIVNYLFTGGPPPIDLAFCGGEEAAAANGDTNGDGTLDISDAVLLFNWLYGGGPEPMAACADGGGGGHARHPRLVPPKIFRGKLYSALIEAWWQWALSIPEDGHPLVNGSCDVGQSGPVWNLGGSFGSDSASVRDCTVPRGKLLFFPIINTECSSVETDEFHCDDEGSCLACSGTYLSGDDTLSLTIDGFEIRNLQRFRTQSGLFEFGPLPEGAIWGLPAGATGVSVGDGYHVLVAPLSRGEHTIHFIGCFAAFGGCEGWELNFTYNITVE